MTTHITQLEFMDHKILLINGADNDDVVASDVTFSDANAEGVRFDCATLARIAFIRCDLYWASFFLAQLTDVTFEQCDLRGADFKQAKLDNCRFLHCDVGTDAIGGETQFDGTDLSSVEFVSCRGR